MRFAIVLYAIGFVGCGNSTGCAIVASVAPVRSHRAISGSTYGTDVKSGDLVCGYPVGSEYRGTVRCAWVQYLDWIFYDPVSHLTYDVPVDRLCGRWNHRGIADGMRLDASLEVGAVRLGGTIVGACDIVGSQADREQIVAIDAQCARRDPISLWRMRVRNDRKEIASSRNARFTGASVPIGLQQERRAIVDIRETQRDERRGIVGTAEVRVYHDRRKIRRSECRFHARRSA